MRFTNMDKILKIFNKQLRLNEKNCIKKVKNSGFDRRYSEKRKTKKDKEND